MGVVFYRSDELRRELQEGGKLTDSDGSATATDNDVRHASDLTVGVEMRHANQGKKRQRSRARAWENVCRLGKSEGRVSTLAR